MDYIIDRALATQALNEGFVIVVGEKHREFLTSVGEQLIVIGIKNGIEWANQIKINSADNVTFMLSHKMYDANEKEDLINDLKWLYFTDKEITKIVENKNGDRNVSSSLFTKGSGKLESLIESTILVEDFTCKTAKPFHYFKKFPLYAQAIKTCTLFGEGGLSLDEYNSKNVRYYKSEGELSYMVEDLGRKYLYLGMLLGRQQVLFDFVKILESKLNPELNTWVKSTCASIIYGLTFELHARQIIEDIQKKTNVYDDFMAHEQVHKAININLTEEMIDEISKKFNELDKKGSIL
jgi:hypothetical protein